eukprot:EG_transcript_29479
MAAAYPRQPDPTKQQQMQQFLASWASLYPCLHCGAHMKDCMEEEPPRLQSRESLSVWVCELHNKVNDLLDKPAFDCSYASIMARWSPSGRDAAVPRPSNNPLANLDCQTQFCPEERKKL